VKVRLSQKMVALAATGIVLLSGATVTSLAAWTDTEWVNGGVGTVPNVSSSQFGVEQNVTTSASANWATEPTSPGGVVDFGTAAASLTPGTSVVGFVRLRTVANSIGGTLTLVHGTSTGSSALLGALVYGAWLHPDSSTCTATQYNGLGFEQLVPDNSPIVTDSTVPVVLVPGVGNAPGTELTVCFRLTLAAPTGSADTSLQGLSADPIWQFDAISN
jgi:predicted ribosomally synthesized peptide with SipW-like signal peptide